MIIQAVALCLSVLQGSLRAVGSLSLCAAELQGGLQTVDSVALHAACHRTPVKPSCCIFFKGKGRIAGGLPQQNLTARRVGTGKYKHWTRTSNCLCTWIDKLSLTLELNAYLLQY